MKLHSVRARVSRLARLACAALAVALVATLAWPHAALGVTELSYNPQVNPVADNVTRLEVSKLEKGTRDAVVGARLQIIDKTTGQVMDEWVSDGSAHLTAKILNVSDEQNTYVYVLHEVSAPEGYELAPDTEFILRTEDFNTKGEVLNAHDDVEFSEISGSGDQQAFVLNLYDRAVMEQVKEEHVKREVKRKLPQTSDLFDPTAVYVLGACGLAAVALGIRLRRE